VLGPALVLGNMFLKQRLEALAAVSFIAVGTVVYYLFTRRRAQPVLEPLSRGP
jgi:hypothetical protein